MLRISIAKNRSLKSLYDLEEKTSEENKGITSTNQTAKS